MSNSSASPQHDMILASASPRRRELLAQIGVRFSVIVHEIDEIVRSGEDPIDYVRRLAREKALSVVDHAGGLPVLGADTIVVCEGHILGKPVDRSDALRMLALLSGRSHRVYTAVTLATADGMTETLSESEVRFRSLSQQECEQYWASGEPLGKAGAYAVQGLAAVFVERLSGSYSGIVGLPLFETYRLLQQCGIKTALMAGSI